jgi:hypothetical protein
MKKLVNTRLTHFLEKKRLFNNGAIWCPKEVHTKSQAAFREKQHFLLVSLGLIKTYDTSWRYNVIGE